MEKRIYWVYTNDGRKVGEFPVGILDSQTEEEANAWAEKCFRIFCQNAKIDIAAHNICLGRII